MGNMIVTVLPDGRIAICRAVVVLTREEARNIGAQLQSVPDYPATFTNGRSEAFAESKPEEMPPPGIGSTET